MIQRYAAIPTIFNNNLTYLKAFKINLLQGFQVGFQILFKHSIDQ